MTKNYYITTTLPYVNAAPHIGLALEVVQADALARYHRLSGDNVLYNFGADEHGLKIYRKAVGQKKDPQKYVDEYAKKYEDLKKALNLSYNHFIRTTDKDHTKAAQEFWKICDKNSYIYKKNYKTKYCIGCELEKTDSELVDGKCPTHPTLKLEIIEEENYFFRFSKFRDKLLKLYKEKPNFVVPGFRLKEIETFVQDGLQDFSISRLKRKMPWGIEVPGDPEHVMYVWFDALINYISTIGWPNKKTEFKKWWPVVQCAGKDNLRQQSAIWQAMLASVNLPFSKQIFIHGFISSGGERMSKSLGNVVDPYELVKKYGTDVTRYFLLAKIHPFKDSDFTLEKLESAHNDDLANGLGNLVSRVVGMTQKYFEGEIPKPAKDPDRHPLRVGNGIYNWKKTWIEIDKSFETYRFDKGLEAIRKFVSEADRYIEKEKPWELSKDGKKEKLAWVIYGLCDSIHQIAWQIAAYLPETSREIASAFKIKKLLVDQPDYKDSWTNIKSGTILDLKKPLFPRLSQ